MESARNGVARVGDNASSRSPSSFSGSSRNSRVSSGVSSNARGPRRLAAEGATGNVGDLASRLAAAEHELKENSNPSSQGDSEERDTLFLAQQIEEDLEHRSSARSSEVNNRRDVQATSSGADEARAVTETSKSGSSSSVSRDTLIKMQHAAQQEDVGTSSGSSSNNAELLQWLIDSQDARAKADGNVSALKTMVTDMAVKHGLQIDDLQDELEKAMNGHIHSEKEHSQLVSDMASMQKRHAAVNAMLQERVEHARRQENKADDERDDLKDQIAGMEAVHRVRMDNVKVENDVKGERTKESEDQFRKTIADMRKLMKEETAAAASAAAASKVAGKTASDERDIFKRNMQTMQTNHAAQVASLNEQLDHTVRADDKTQKKAVSGSKGKTGDGANGPEPVQPAHLREKNQTMTDELSELRLQMLGMERGHANQVGDLQAQLEAANQKLSEPTGAPGSSRGTLHGAQMLQGKTRAIGARMKGKGLTKLTAIEEDEYGSLDGSMAVSCTVSSDGDDCVGDMADFDEVAPEQPLAETTREDFIAQILGLEEALASDQAAHTLFKEIAAGRDAQASSKAQRLLELLKETRENRGVMDGELASLKESVEKDNAMHGTHVDCLQVLLNQAQAKYVKLEEEHEAEKGKNSSVSSQRTNDTESLQQQLFCAVEMRRIAEARLHEFKQAMATQENQHQMAISDLKQQLMVAQGKSQQRSDCGSADSQTSTGRGEDDLNEQLISSKDELRASMEERNILVNSFEWKEVQWKSKIENVEIQREAEVKELRLHYDNEITMLKSRLEASEKAEASAKQLLTSMPTSATTTVTIATPAPPVGGQAAAWLDLLRCPVRMASPAGSSSFAVGAAYCQDICWRILNAVQGITALLCSSADFMILEATKSAGLLWGSSALHGRSILTLVNGASRAAWLRKAFQMHQRIADAQSDGIPGFVIRDLGCEEFMSKTGQVFDSSVITAHLPAEPKCGKEASLLVIIEPQNNAGQCSSPAPASAPAPAVTRPSRKAHQSMDQQSTHSEVSSVDPNDSASNIFPRGAGFFSQH